MAGRAATSDNATTWQNFTCLLYGRAGTCARAPHSPSPCLPAFLPCCRCYNYYYVALPRVPIPKHALALSRDYTRERLAVRVPDAVLDAWLFARMAVPSDELLRSAFLCLVNKFAAARVPDVFCNKC